MIDDDVTTHGDLKQQEEHSLDMDFVLSLGQKCLQYFELYRPVCVSSCLDRHICRPK